MNQKRERENGDESCDILKVEQSRETFEVMFAKSHILRLHVFILVSI